MAEENDVKTAEQKAEEAKAALENASAGMQEEKKDDAPAAATPNA